VRDLLGRQAGDQFQGERHPCVARQHRVARGEDQPQHVVLDVRVELYLVHGVLGLRELPADLLGLAVEDGLPSHAVDVATACDGGQPRPRVVRHPGRRPLLEGGDQGVLG
jgi:hypothetical protein